MDEFAGACSAKTPVDLRARPRPARDAELHIAPVPTPSTNSPRCPAGNQVHQSPVHQLKSALSRTHARWGPRPRTGAVDLARSSSKRSPRAMSAASTRCRRRCGSLQIPAGQAACQVVCHQCSSCVSARGQAWPFWPHLTARQDMCPIGPCVLRRRLRRRPYRTRRRAAARFGPGRRGNQRTPVAALHHRPAGRPVRRGRCGRSRGFAAGRPRRARPSRTRGVRPGSSAARPKSMITQWPARAV